MSDVNLLVFGCAVSFIALAGFYVYIRESYISESVPDAVGSEPDADDRPNEVTKSRLSDVA